MRLGELKSVLWSQHGEVQFAVVYDADRGVDIEEGCTVDYAVKKFANYECVRLQAYNNDMIIYIKGFDGITESAKRKSVRESNEVTDYINSRIETSFNSPKKRISPADKSRSVKDLYIEMYPDDELGDEIVWEDSLADLWNFLKMGTMDIYDALGVGDSVVRERVMNMIADVYNIDYDVVYYVGFEGQYGALREFKRDYNNGRLDYDELKKKAKQLGYNSRSRELRYLGMSSDSSF